MAPLRFALKPLKKRRRQEKKHEEKERIVCSVFDSGKDIRTIQNQLRRVKQRIDLLEDGPTKVKRLKDEGNVLAEAGRFQAAMSRWKEALSVEPNHAILYELLAQASMAIYEDFHAVQFARTATELAPMWSDGFLTLARSLLNFGEITLALQALQQTVKLNDGVETEEMTSNRQDIEELLIRQECVLSKHEEEAARQVEADKLQVISCFKHLTLRAKTRSDK